MLMLTLELSIYLSRVLQADWFRLVINEKATLNINMPCSFRVTEKLGSFLLAQSSHFCVEGMCVNHYILYSQDEGLR